MSTPFERAIEKIESEISINKDLVEIYTKDFDAIRDHVLNEMSRHDDDFRRLYKGPSLFGSYLDNIKVDKPDEFDVHFVLELPCNEQLKVTCDELRPGFVNMNAAKIARSIGTTCNQFSCLKPVIDAITDDHYFISRLKLQTWLKTILEGVFKEKNQSVRSFTGHMYKLSYSKCATAHTIKADCGARQISIDLVPAFAFTKGEDLYFDREFPAYVKQKIWFAVPKGISKVDKNTDGLSFMVCAPQIERDILFNKDNLKRSLRLLKSLRDNMGPKARQLKSYFLKTIYLYEVQSRSEEFWKKPVGEILKHMIGVLINRLNSRNLPFYWAGKQNLLRLLDQSDTDFLVRSFQHVLYEFRKVENSRFDPYPELNRLFDNPRSRR